MAYTLKAFMEVEGRKSPWDNPSWGLARKSPSVVVRKSPCEEACKTPLEEAFEEAYKAYVEEDCKPYRVESREGYRKEFQSHLDTIASDNKLARKASILVPKELDALSDMEVALACLREYSDYQQSMTSDIQLAKATRQVEALLNSIIYRMRLESLTIGELMPMNRTSNNDVIPRGSPLWLARHPPMLPDPRGGVSDEELVLGLQAAVGQREDVLALGTRSTSWGYATSQILYAPSMTKFITLPLASLTESPCRSGKDKEGVKKCSGPSKRAIPGSQSHRSGPLRINGRT
ncbi:hypothetical protein FEM48_Zijuj12G0092900 [Ziziphus jujuba var. spinosa]|uniref:Uncharacterized protein n=1 Tax=Ziziphus jujuba var. spinosa TaxID=714518 RepID=A0A978UCG5_ZIZJJ|nr:hypothetical protein FEM48_Zijuj12G0092900 [Ziziphus jujuba var. spinosa]